MYFDALARVANALRGTGAPFCLVGGGAVQAWIATLRTDEGQRSLSNEPLLESALRKTRDLDFATRSGEADMTRLLNSIAAESSAGAHVLGPRSLRIGPVAVSLTLGPDDLSGMSELYDRFLESRTPVRLKRASRVEEFPAIGLEELIATKITRRGDKAKDLVDVGQLLAALRAAGRSPDFAGVRLLVDSRPDAVRWLEELEEAWREEEQ